MPVLWHPPGESIYNVPGLTCPGPRHFPESVGELVNSPMSVDSRMSTSSELRVFISSTFRDMQEEREHLVKKIFPEIRSLCRQRGVTFTDVDLRWGLTEEEATLGRVIRTCLEEIDKCRPYFIGMIGNRYGWVPELHEVLMDPDLLAKYPWVEDLAIDGASVTEMEFVHGVFDAPEIEAESTFFYHQAGEISLSDDPEHLQALIDRARATGRPFREYSEVDALGKMVRDDLVAMIDENWPESEAPSEVEVERRAHAAFAASRVRAYIPNPLHLKSFSTWLSEGEKPLVIHGPSGLGKSSLVAYLVAYYRRKNPNAFVVEHYVGVSEGGGSAVSVMRHVVAEICERFGIEEEIPAEAEKLRNSFPNWLFRAEHLAEEAGVPMLVVIDAVNQLGENGQRMTWLPMTIPAGLQLIVSTTPGGTEDRLTEREWQHLEVTPLEDERIRQSIVVRYLGEFRKGISPDQLRRVISDPKAHSPLFLRVVAEELRLHGEHETIDAMIDRYGAAADLLDVFDLILARMESDYGVVQVTDLLRLIGASRNGLSESELLDLLGTNRLDLSRLLFAFDYHLLRRDGLLGFFHDYLRRAVERRYLGDEQTRDRTHLGLAEHFESGELNERSAGEQIWQYAQAGNDGRLLTALANPAVLHLAYTNTGVYEVLSEWSRLRDAGHDPEAIYQTSVEKETGDVTLEQLKSWATVANVLERLSLWTGAIEIDLRLLLKASEGGFLAEVAGAEQRLGGLSRLRGDFADALDRLDHALHLFEELGDRSGASRAVGNIGLVYAERGEYDRALESYQRSLTISEELGNRRGVSIAVGGMGIVYYSRGEYDRALESFQRQLTIAEELSDRNTISMAMGSMGIVYSSRGEYDRALESLQRSLTISEELGDRRGVSLAVGNMGNVYYSRGEYDLTLELYQRQLTISEELGERRGASLALGNIGHVYHESGEYDLALDAFARASAEHRAIGFPYGLTSSLVGSARALLELAESGDLMPEFLPKYLPDISEATWHAHSLRFAREHAEECVAKSREISRPDMLFEGRVLLARMDAAEDRRDVAARGFHDLLQETEDDDERAELRYWLWKLGEDDHGKTALELYESLYARTPKHQNKQRLDELKAARFQG